MKRRRMIVLAVLAVIAAAWWYVVANPEVLVRVGLTAPEPPGVLASGFIEAAETAIAAETGGRIVSIVASEGDLVKAGDMLLRLDDAVIRAQQQQAEAGVKLARAGLEQVQASSQQAAIVRDGAKRVLDSTLDIQANPLDLEARITAARNELASAELALSFDMEIDRYRALPKSQYWTVAFATQRRDNARAALESLLNIKSNPQEVRTAVERARSAYDAAAAAAEVAARGAAIAERQVEQAEATLNVVRRQSERLLVASPVSGQVATRRAEVGEVVQAGFPVLTIAQTDEMTLTAYVPESKLGLVRVGQEARVSVDSYPGMEFGGQVTHIGTRALFTPRNVQLKDERERTMYPVKVRLPNPEGKLKAGMPADARILAGQ